MQAILGRCLGRKAFAFISASIFSWPAMAAETPALPDFSGIWGRNFPFFELPDSGNGPIQGKPRTGNGQPHIGNFDSPMLKPEAAVLLKKRGEISASGAVIPDPVNQCWPEPTPFTLAAQFGIQILQHKDGVTIFHLGDHKVRHIHMNVPHPANVTPTWQGHSVGHYEGDTLVIDTVGQKVGPYSMVDLYGTPFSPALHVVERYKLIDGEAAYAAVRKHEAKYIPNGGSSYIIGEYGRGLIDPDKSRKGLQVEIMVEDPGMFNNSWTALVTYRPAGGRWPEAVCAENQSLGATGKAQLPYSDKADF